MKASAHRHDQQSGADAVHNDRTHDRQLTAPVCGSLDDEKV